MNMKFQLDPAQIDRAAKDLISRQNKEIAKLKKKIDSLKFDLDRANRVVHETKNFRVRVEDAKRVLRDLLDIEDDI